MSTLRLKSEKKRKLHSATRKALYMYHEHKDNVEAYEGEADGYRSGWPNARGKGSHGDPTGHKGVMRLQEPEPVRKSRLWVSAIDAAWGYMQEHEPQKAKILEIYFGLSNRGGRPYAHKMELENRIMDELYISQPTFYRWLDETIDAVVHAAIQYAVLTPYKEKPPA